MSSNFKAHLRNAGVALTALTLATTLWVPCLLFL
jgi:hypothetical protein